MSLSDLHYFWQDHPGARWLIPMIAILLITIVGVLAMIVYPHASV